jgi:DNA adenine methylase
VCRATFASPLPPPVYIRCDSILTRMTSPSVAETARVRPFLKWAGGKRQLLEELRRFVPPEFRAYHEPFLGSAALFFDLCRRGRLVAEVCRLTDLNADLIGCYDAVGRDVERVTRELRRLAAAHELEGSTAYYRVRDELFNPRRRARIEVSDRSAYPADLAAMFIYLNRTGYNGLYRLNARGDFNVPAGRYAKPRICDEDTLRSAADILKRSRVDLRVASFHSVADAAQPRDLVYLDPPYAPLTSTARFTSYTPASFSDHDQKALRDIVMDLARRGCFVVLSNSTAPLVTDLYDTKPARRIGLRLHRVPARRAINSKGAKRGVVEEYIVSNVAPSAAMPRMPGLPGMPKVTR